MGRSTIEERLHELATSSTGRSETDRLRDVFTSVEKAIAAGVGRKAVLEALHADGFTMSMKMFDKALYRIRKETKVKEESIPGRNTPRTEMAASSIPRRFVHNPTPREDLLD